MTKKNLIIPFFFIALLSNCQNKDTIVKTTSVIKTNLNCKEIIHKYNEKFIAEENDSALFYINKAIECNPKNNKYKDSKVRFLIGIKSYKEARLQLDELIKSTNDPAFKLLKGIIKLKVKESDSRKFLDESYIEFSKINKPTSGNIFYKIALDNYFKGREFSLAEIQKFKEKFKEPYEIQNINALEQLILNNNKEEVLFSLFNIKD